MLKELKEKLDWEYNLKYKKLRIGFILLLDLILTIIVSGLISIAIYSIIK